MALKTLTKFLGKIQHLFFTSFPKYSLTLVDLETIRNKTICIFKVSGDLMPMKIPLEEVFTSKNILINLEPTTILLLKEFQIKNQRVTARIKTIERSNHYVIVAEDQETTLSGDKICRDKYLLSSLSIDDAFKIIYSTAYKNGVTDLKSQSTNTKTSPTESSILRLVK